MNNRVEFYRVIVIREEDGRSREVTLRQPIMRRVRKPILTETGFGAVDYFWDGKETNVQGLPVFK